MTAALAIQQNISPVQKIIEFTALTRAQYHELITRVNMFVDSPQQLTRTSQINK